MMGLTILPKKYYDILDTQTALLASIASKVGDGGIAVDDWDDVQRLTRMGVHNKMFVEGDQFLTTYNNSPFATDIIGMSHDTPTDKTKPDSLTLQFHDCLDDVQFSAPQALYNATTELAPGTHIFILNNVTFEFTTTVTVPEGGVVWAGTWTDPYVPAKITTYAPDRSTVLESGVDVVAGSGAPTLLVVNHHSRCRYGGNRYVDSAIRQWLNSEATQFKWQAQGLYDMPSTTGVYAGAGFLKRLDPKLVAVLGAVDKVVAKNTITDGGGSETISDKVFLLSRSEVYAGLENSINEGAPYPYYSALASASTSGALAGRIKYLSGSARYWWLRSPYSGNATHVRTVNTAGELYSHSSAGSAYGVAPACCIV